MKPILWDWQGGDMHVMVELRCVKEVGKLVLRTKWIGLNANEISSKPFFISDGLNTLK